VVHGGILLLSDKVLDAGFVIAYSLVEFVCFLLGLDLSGFSWLATGVRRGQKSPRWQAARQLLKMQW
jgi:hypothetical protein